MSFTLRFPNEWLITRLGKYGDCLDWTLGIQGHTISSVIATSRSGETGLEFLHPRRADSFSYIVDFEVCDDYSDEPEHELSFSDDDFITWCLAEQDIQTENLRL